MGFAAEPGIAGHSLMSTLPVDCEGSAVSMTILKITGLSMNKPADVTREHAVEIRFGQVGLVQVRLHTMDPGAILDELTGRTATAPNFFERTAVCLDLAELHRDPHVDELRAVMEVVKRAGMLAVGLAQGGASVDSLARELD